MELLETQDPEKKRLLETSDRHRLEMEREINDISQKTEKVLKNALIIGGALVLTYLVVNQFSSSNSNKKKSRKDKVSDPIGKEQADESPTMLSKMGDKAMNMATVLLLDLAKEKLSEYLQKRKSKDEDS